MKSKSTQVIFGGIIATIVMTILMMLGAQMGLPKMNPPAMLANTMNTALFIGWIIHFTIGIVFAFLYGYFIMPYLGKINNNLIKGIIFGIIAFIIAQIGMQLMNLMISGMKMPEGNMIMILMGSLIGHIVFGVVVAYFVKPAVAKNG